MITWLGPSPTSARGSTGSIITRHADLLFVTLAWMFVLLRLVHAGIHVTDNDLRRRGAVIAGDVEIADER